MTELHPKCNRLSIQLLLGCAHLATHPEDVMINPACKMISVDKTSVADASVQQPQSTLREGTGAAVRIALIVGGSSGIGLASARELITRGYVVVLMARDANRLTMAAQELGSGTTTAPADVLDADAVDQVVQNVVAKYGSLDVVVHTAQVMAYGRIEDVPPDIFERTVETATHGTANLARAVLPVFRRQGKGSLIIVNSLLGHIVVPQMGTYVIAKWAQLAMIKTLQLETRDAPGIHISEVSPGAIDTPVYEQAANYTGRTPAPPPPVLSPAVMARAVADCIESPHKHVDVGPGNKIVTLGFRLMPWVYDRVVGPLARLVVFRGPAVPPSDGNVLSPIPGREAERGGWSLLGTRRRND